MSFDVNGKVALVTGANRGIGEAITKVLIENGVAKVYTAVRDVSSVESLKNEYGDKIVPVEIDLTKPETIKAAAETASDVELVVSNAGILKTATALDENAFDALQTEMEVNVFGLMRMAQAFAPVLKSNGGGAFAQLNSVASLRTFPPFSTYAASKAAAYSITQALRALLDEQGTHIVSVHPGPIDTDMAKDAGIEDMAEPPELVGEAIVSALKSSEFHAWPDSMAKELGDAYSSFAESVVESEMQES